MPSSYLEQLMNISAFPAEIRQKMVQAEIYMSNDIEVPEQRDIIARYPTVDPLGKFSPMEMEFALREQKVDSFLNTRSPEARAFANEIRASSKFQELRRDIHALSQMHRFMTRLKRGYISEGSAAYGALEERIKAIENCPAMKQMDLALKGLENLSGADPVKINPTANAIPLSGEVRQFYLGEIGVPLPDSLLRAAVKTTEPPDKITVYLQSMDGRKIQREVSDLQDGDVDPDMLSKSVENLAVGAVENALLPVLPLLEDSGLSVKDLMELTVVGDQTLKEVMEASGHLHESASAEEQKREIFGTLGAALSAGKKVSVFLPDQDGKLSPKPTELTQQGLDIKRLSPVEMSWWEKFWSFFGFYQEKAAQYDAYREQQDSPRIHERACQSMREHLGADVFPSPEQQQLKQITRQAQTACRAQAMQRGMKLIKVEANYRNLLESYRLVFGLDKPIEIPRSVSDQENPQDVYRNINRTTGANICMGILLSKGHSLKDVLNPSMLQDEKRQIGEQLRQHVEKNDKAWYADNLALATRAITKTANDLSKGHDWNPPQFIDDPDLASYMMISYAGFDLSQEVTNKSFIKPYYLSTMGEEAYNKMSDELTQSYGPGSILSCTVSAQCQLYQAGLGLARWDADNMGQAISGEIMLNHMKKNGISPQTAQLSTIGKGLGTMVSSLDVPRAIGETIKRPSDPNAPLVLSVLGAAAGKGEVSEKFKLQHPDIPFGANRPLLSEEEINLFGMSMMDSKNLKLTMIPELKDKGIGRKPEAPKKAPATAKKTSEKQKTGPSK